MYRASSVWLRSCTGESDERMGESGPAAGAAGAAADEVEAAAVDEAAEAAAAAVAAEKARRGHAEDRRLAEEGACWRGARRGEGR